MKQFTTCRYLALLSSCLLLLWGCDAPPTSGSLATGPGRGDQPSASAAATAATEPEEATNKPKPPTPPLAENFDGDPQLSIFPRVGKARPDPADSQQTGIWAAYIDHLLRTSAVAPREPGSPDRALTFKGFQGIESLGFFSPLAVVPGTRYTVSFSARGELGDSAGAGIGLLEYREFLWIGQQFTEEELGKYLTGTNTGARMQSSNDWQDYQFSFTAGPDTRMIHLIFYLDGENDNRPVFFDNIRIEPAS